MIIATRTLTIVMKDRTIPVAIRLYLPESITPYYKCRYEIDWPENPVKSFAAGNDGIAAVHAAIEKVGMELYMSRYHHERTLEWIKPWQGYGFPLPKGARDLLIGDDQQFYGEGPLGA